MWFLSESLVVVSFGLEQLRVVWRAVDVSVERGVVTEAENRKDETLEVLEEARGSSGSAGGDASTLVCRYSVGSESSFYGS